MDIPTRQELATDVDTYGAEITLKIKVSIGAGGTDFAADLLTEIERGSGKVYMQVAGEYGHLIVEELNDFEVS